MSYHNKKSMNSKTAPSYRVTDIIALLPPAHPLMRHLVAINRYFPRARILSYRVADMSEKSKAPEQQKLLL